MLDSLFDWCVGGGANAAGDGSAARVLIALRSGCVLEARPGGVSLGHPWGGVSLDEIPVPVREVLHQAAVRWIEPDAAVALLTSDFDGSSRSVRALSEALWHLGELEFAFQVQLRRGEITLLTLEAVSPKARLAFTDEAATPRIPDDVYLASRPDGVRMESATGYHRARVHDAEVWALLGSLAGMTGRPFPTDDAAKAAVTLLAAAGLINGHAAENPAPRTGTLRSTHAMDLLFHRLSRFGGHDGAFGATYPMKDLAAPQPAVPSPYSPNVVALARPDDAAIERRDPTLLHAMETRRSTRAFADVSISLEDLSEFLYRCARVRARYGPDEALGLPHEVSDRPCPAGGAVHDLELYVLAGAVSGLAHGIYHYAADRHALELMPAGEAALVSLAAWTQTAAGVERPPQVLIVITSRFARMAWKYESIAYATTLKNVGVMYQAMYLVATAMGLGGCALGSGDDLASEAALRLAERGELPVGEFMLGVPARHAPLTHPGPSGAEKTLQPLAGFEWGRVVQGP